MWLRKGMRASVSYVELAGSMFSEEICGTPP
jgi:hypothetical protein